MTLYFAYGSNMDRAAMALRCPAAFARGTGVLAGWRFLIMRDGYASIVPAAGRAVHGVLWRLTPRDRAALNAYESLHSGLYVTRLLPVQTNTGRTKALVYIGRTRVAGPPRPGYLDQVLAAAHDWGLPTGYCAALARLASSGWRGARERDTGAIG